MKFIHVYIVILIFTGISAQAQDQNLQKMDRERWKELVNEIKQRRYDPKEVYEEPVNETEREYSTRENADRINDNGSGYEDGIYTNDDEFFDESKDGTTGDNYENGNDELNPKYNDKDQFQDEGRGSKYSEGSTKYEEKQRDYTPPPKPERTTSSSSSSAGGGNFTWLLWLLGGLLLAVIVYMIITSFSDKNKKVKTAVETTAERMENLTITKSELELALEAALKDKNYREAVRIYFIAVIKEMKDRSWIRWEKKKTNYHYINEISGRSQQPDFITATRAFEIVWYGNRSVTENEYYSLEPHFKKLLSSIHH